MVKLAKDADGAVRHKCHSLNMDLERLHKEGKISAEDALHFSNDGLDDAFSSKMKTNYGLEKHRDS